MTPQGLGDPSEIARLTGVSRAVINAWLRREVNPFGWRVARERTLLRLWHHTDRSQRWHRFASNTES
jgi:hypothetical protein